MACLAGMAWGAVVPAADGDTVVIGTDVSNAASYELVVTTGVQGVTLVLPPADEDGISTVWTRIYLKGTGTASFAAAEGETPNAIVIASGLAADDTVTLHVAAPSVTTLGVGVLNVANVSGKLHGLYREIWRGSRLAGGEPAGLRQRVHDGRLRPAGAFG